MRHTIPKSIMRTMYRTPKCGQTFRLRGDSFAELLNFLAMPVPQGPAIQASTVAIKSLRSPLAPVDHNLLPNYGTIVPEVTSRSNTIPFGSISGQPLGPFPPLTSSVTPSRNTYATKPYTISYPGVSITSHQPLLPTFTPRPDTARQPLPKDQRPLLRKLFLVFVLVMIFLTLAYWQG